MSPSGTPRRRRRAWLATAFVVCAFGGATACNALLDNEERTLRGPDAGATESGTPIDDARAGDADEDVIIPGDGGCSPNINADPDHCGACGNKCVVGGCSGGRCQPVPFGPTGNSPNQLFFTQGALYFSYGSGAGSGASWCDVKDCTSPTQFLASGSAVPDFGMAVEGSPLIARVAVISGNDIRIWGLRPAAAPSGTVVVNTAVGPRGVALGLSNTLYFTSNAGEAFLCPAFTGCTPQRIGIGAASGGAIATDNGFLYWGSNDAMQQVRVTDSNTTATAASNGRKPVSILVAGGRLYWTGTGGSYEGEVSYRVIPGSGGALAAANEYLFQQKNGDPWGLTVDATHIYWTMAGGVTAGEIRRCLRGKDGEGCAAKTVPEVIAKGQLQPRGIAVDDTFVYWANRGGSLMKMQKPR